MEPLVITKIEGGVGFIILNRPSALNALNIPLAQQLRAAADRLQDDRSVRAVLIRGAGKHFCAGGDVKWFAAQGDNLAEGLNDLLAILNPLMSQLLNFRVPVVTAVQGMAAGAGAGLALVGDLVVAADSFKLLSSYAAIGLTPDVSVTYSLVRRIGPARAKEFFFRNRPLNAAQCLDRGIVNCIHSEDRFMQEAKQLAAELAEGPTQALRLTRELVDQAWMHNLETQLALERESMAQSGRSHDGREGVRAFLEKRKPGFTGN